MSVYAQDYGYFFDSNAGDRTYNSGSFEEWLRPFFTTGVFNGELEVLAQDDPDMTVTVTGGHANLDGKPGYWPSDNILNVSMASGVYNRIDTVVLRRDNINRRISLEMVTGVASSNPVPTPPTRTNDIFELVIAQIRVRTGTTIIENMDITDTRMDPDVCGWVAATVDQISFDQVKVQFDDWFEHVKGQLDEDAAGHLQNEIDEITENIGDLDGLETQEKTEIVGAINELYENKVDKRNIKYATITVSSLSDMQTKLLGITQQMGFSASAIIDVRFSAAVDPFGSQQGHLWLSTTYQTTIFSFLFENGNGVFKGYYNGSSLGTEILSTQNSVNTLLLNTLGLVKNKTVSTTSADETITINPQALNRHSGILIICNNDGTHGLYFVSHKAGNSSSATKIAGTYNGSITINSSTGVITLPIKMWSRAHYMYIDG